MSKIAWFIYNIPFISFKVPREDTILKQSYILVKWKVY